MRRLGGRGFVQDSVLLPTKSRVVGSTLEKKIAVVMVVVVVVGKQLFKVLSGDTKITPHGSERTTVTCYY